jgi:hypothetical protein
LWEQTRDSRDLIRLHLGTAPAQLNAAASLQNTVDGGPE